MNAGKAKLYLKRSFVLFMTALLTWQTLGVDITYAFAEDVAAATQEAAQQGEGSNVTTESEDGSDQSVSQGTEAATQQTTGSDQSAASVRASSSTAASGTSGSTESENAASTSNEGTDGQSNEPNEAAGQSDEDAIDPVSEGDGNSGSNDTTDTYNSKADPVDVSNDCTATVKFYKDASHNTELGSTAIASNQTFYASLTVDFGATKPTLAKPNVMYTFPANVKVADMAETDLKDGDTLAGKWYIKDNVAYFKYYEDYLNQTVTHAYVNLDCKLNGVNKGDGNNETITFPGTSTSTTLNTKDGDVSGSKFGGDMSQTWNGPTYNQDDNSYTWTIKISPNAYATNVKIEDTIGSNLTFVDGSFKLVDASGQEVSGQCDVTVSGQSATISLGDLTAGDYYVQYKTEVKSLPTTDNTNISNVDNKVKYSWGGNDKRQNGETSKSPQSAKYSMVSKSADGSSTPSAIKWVVKLNNGSIKADMGGYSFSDALGDDQSFLSASGLTVTGADGKDYTPSTVNWSSDNKNLTFTLPNNAGSQELTVTYYTQMTDKTSLDAVKNTAEVTPPDSTHGPAGEGTGTYNPPDNGAYITKTLTSTISSASYDGKASWKSEILFSDMATNTDPTKIVFTDEFSQLPSNVKVSLNSDVKLTVGEGGASLVEGTDYSIEKASEEQGTNNKLFTVTFKDTDAVKALIGQDGAKVVVTYITLTTQVDGEYPAGTYKNKSSVKTDKKSTISAEADYTIEKEATPPDVIKKGGSTSWDADFDWGDGTKGAWITNWTASINRTGEYEYQYAPVLDLGGKDVTVKDTLPANSAIKGSVSYKLRKKSWDTVAEGAVEASTSNDVATITIPTSAAKDPVYIELSYQTATKGTIDSSDTITNTAQASSGDYTFPAGSDTVTLDNKALAKTGSAVSGSSAREYTITVNENAYDLVSGADELTLVDDLDYRGQLSASTISIKDANDTDLLESGQASYSLAKVADGGVAHTRLTITIPDSTKVVVTYRVVPSGNDGDEIKDFSNSCSLSGVVSSATSVTQTFNVATSSGGTGSESWGISLTKYDSSGKKSLEGATFELWKIDLDQSTSENIVKQKVDTQTSDSKGKVSFGTQENPLLSNTLYYFVETAAPEGYEISFTGSTYVMLKSEATKAQYQDAYDKAVALGCTPSSAVSYTAFDELAKGSFKLELSKEVKGADAPKGATFTFSAEATGDNAADAPALSDVQIVTDAKGEKTYTGTFTGSLSDSMKDQAYTYNVRETGTAPNGWTYDSGTYTATVTVTEQDTKLVADVTYAKSGEDGNPVAVDKMTFTNTYAATGTPVLHVKKTVNSGKLDTMFKDKTFAFGVYKADVEGKRTGDALKQVTVSAGKTESVTDFETYTAAGTYRYVIHEEGAAKEGWTLADDVLVTVTAKDNGDGTLALTYSYATHPSDDENAALFDNTYTEPTTATLQAQKKLTGRDMSNEEFSFNLIDKNEGTTKDQVIDSASAPAAKDGVAATVTFGALRYTKAGTYTYGIQEVKGNLAHVTYDESVYTAKVEVAKDEDTGKLSATVTYLDSANKELGEGKLPTFNNTYTAASGSFTLKAKKTVNGGSLKKDESFTFSATATGENADSAPAFENATTDTDGIATFATANIGEGNIGKTYSYTIHEESDLDETHWAKASDVTVTVTIGQRDDNNEIPVTVKYNDQETDYAPFDNTYSTSTTATLKVSKVAEGATDAEKDQEFTFALYEENETEALQTVNAKAGETVSFPDAITYNAAGSYKYDIKELGQNGSGWTLASATTATVTVKENDDRSLTATVEYGRANTDKTAVLFTNKYAASGTATIKVSKTINGEAPATDKTFDFELEAVSKDAPMPEGTGNKVTTTGSAVASFGSITYSAADTGKTYEYRIVETSNLGTGWTKASPLKVTVKVGDDNGDGTLKESTVTYGEDETATSGVMNNLYESGTASISVEKTVNGGPIAEGEKFTFTLLDKDNKQIGSEITATKQNPTVTFDKLTFDEAGAYTYTVHETSDLGEGWTNDADITVTLKVEAVDGKFKVTKTTYGDVKRGYDKDGNYIVKFNNKYSTSVTTHLSVSKTVLSGTDATNDTTFSFALYDKTGMTFNPKPIDTLTGVKANETKQFAKDLTFSGPGVYQYCIHEVTNGLSDAWLTGADVYAYITVGMNENRTLFIHDIKYGSSVIDTAAVFINTYAPAKSTIEVEKTVNGGPIAEGEKFTFTLLDSNGKQVGSEITATKDSPTVAFDKLTFENAGTYTYTVHETTELGDGWTNDADVDVTLTVEKVDGKLTVTDVTYGDDTRGYDQDGNYIVKFDDKYDAKATKSEIKVEKTVNGGPIETGEKFTFTLLDKDGKKVTGTDEITATKENPTVSFGELAFDKAGTYVYTVHETSDLGTGWTNDDDFTVTFTVMLGDDRNLHVTSIVYGERGYEADGTVVAKFDNKYQKPEIPDEKKPEQPEQPKQPEQTAKATTKTVIPATDDANKGMLAITCALAVSGMALIALGLRKARRTAR